MDPSSSHAPVRPRPSQGHRLQHVLALLRGVLYLGLLTGVASTPLSSASFQTSARPLLGSALILADHLSQHPTGLVHPPTPLLPLSHQQQPQAVSCISQLNLANFQACVASCDTSKGACTASSCCLVVQGPVVTVCYNGCCQIQDTQTAITSFASSNICSSSPTTPSTTNRTNIPVPATPSVQDIFPGGPICSIPQDRTAAFENCVQSCSLNAQTCSASDCCVSVTSHFTSYCLGNCCGSFSHNTGQVRFAQSAACTAVKAAQTTPTAAIQTPTATETASPSTSPLTSQPSHTPPSPIVPLLLTPTPAFSTTPIPTPVVSPPPNASVLPTPRANATASPMTNTSASSHNGNCFPAHSLVQLASGALRRMDQLAVGDRVQVGHSLFSDVFMFTHQIPDATATFVHLQTNTGEDLVISHGHYVYANGVLVPAATVKVGDSLDLASGHLATVRGVSEVVSAGLYNPQTLHGDIAVNGIIASTYTTALSPIVGHVWLSPLRYVYTKLGFMTAVFTNGADHIIELLPSGLAEC